MDSGSLKKLTGLEEEAISDVPAAIIALNIKTILIFISTLREGSRQTPSLKSVPKLCNKKLFQLHALHENVFCNQKFNFY